ADVADDRMGGEGHRPAGHTRLLRPRLSFGVAGRRAPEKDRGVEGRPFGACAVKRPREPLFRVRVLKERPVPYLDAVPVFAGKAAKKALKDVNTARAEGRRQLYPKGVNPLSEGFDRGQESAQRAVGVGETTLVGDQLRQLENETEVRTGLRGP